MLGPLQTFLAECLVRYIQNQATDLARFRASLSKAAHGIGRNLVASSSEMGGGIYVRGLFMQVGGPILQ